MIPGIRLSLLAMLAIMLEILLVWDLIFLASMPNHPSFDAFVVFSSLLLESAMNLLPCPINENAGGIAEMAGMSRHIHERTDALNVSDNTATTVGRGFAIGSDATDDVFGYIFSIIFIFIYFY